MRDDVEIASRAAFEQELIPSKLAPLWMSHHGYSSKTEEQVQADTTMNIKVDYGE
jgi:hypothetical protein